MDPSHCPECKADFKGAEIPEKYRHHYEKTTHYSRVIGIYDMERDYTSHWKCPDCGHVWERK